MAEAAVVVAPRRRLVPLSIGAGIAFLILCGLGVWQIQRLGWKENLIATVNARTHLPPVAAPDPAAWPSLVLDDADYLPVSVSGTYHNDEEAHVYEALEDPVGAYGGSGYFILVPFQTDAGWWVIVNRGFVPQERIDPATRGADMIDGETSVSGLLRPPQGRNAFTPKDDPVGNLWFTRDPATIAAAFGLPADQVAPYYIDAAFDPALPDGLPQGGETTVSFPNSHLEYIFTWFGLAASLVGVYIAYVRGLIRRKPPVPIVPIRPTD